LCVVRRGELEAAVPGAGCAEPRLDAGQRRTRHRRRSAACCRGGRRRLSRLPYTGLLYAALPQGHCAHRRHRRPEARDGARGVAGRTDRQRRAGRNGRRAARRNGSDAMGAASAARRWYWQRISAMAVTVFVLAHLALVTWAVRGGLSAAEVLGRTQGSVGWGVFYA